MAVDMYRMYMDERLLAQLDCAACSVYSETVFGEDFTERPVSDPFSLQWSGTRPSQLQTHCHNTDSDPLQMPR